ncbi:MAG: hypothetical protein J6S38_06070 [Erysipelotrichaceae bacterium]|nr:hypothetical protein [Erysipelotrichaceae bacterium]
MIEKIKKYIEPDKKIRTIGFVILAVLIITAIVSFVKGTARLNSDPGEPKYQGTVVMQRDESYEDYDEDSTVCDVVYTDGEDKLIVTYAYEDYVELEDESIEAYKYTAADGTNLYFDHKDPGREEVLNTYRQITAEELMPAFNLGNALLILSLSLLIMLLFSRFFSLYEKCWFLSIMSLATIFAVIFPE